MDSWIWEKMFLKLNEFLENSYLAKEKIKFDAILPLG